MKECPKEVRTIKSTLDTELKNIDKSSELGVSVVRVELHKYRWLPVLRSKRSKAIYFSRYASLWKLEKYLRREIRSINED